MGASRAMSAPGPQQSAGPSGRPRPTRLGWLRPVALRVVAAGVAGAALLTFGPAAFGARTANLGFNVTFSANGNVSVTLPDGTVLGSTGGAPTVIPAGFYTVSLFGPGECINLPLWTLKGPGVNLEDDMRGGEVERNQLSATFLPNSTYTWHLDRSAAVVHT